MERYYTTNMGYSSAALPDTACRTELIAHYSFDFSAGPAAATFTIEATPQEIQASQDNSGTLIITLAGPNKTNTHGSCYAIPHAATGNQQYEVRRVFQLCLTTLVLPHRPPNSNTKQK